MNRLTEQLEQLQDSVEFPYIGYDWTDVPLLVFSAVGDIEYSPQEMEGVKWLLMCFIATMTDEDLMECFGI